jgi:hypothetical protein
MLTPAADVCLRACLLLLLLLLLHPSGCVTLCQTCNAALQLERCRTCTAGAAVAAWVWLARAFWQQPTGKLLYVLQCTHNLPSVFRGAFRAAFGVCYGVFSGLFSGVALAR